MDPYIGELKLVAFNFPPRGWMPCNGQLLAINQYQALFALLGTAYGGDGIRTFALPQLQGRTPIAAGPGYSIGQAGGAESITLTSFAVPSHTHAATAMSSNANATAASGSYLAATTASLAIYNSNSNVVALNSATVQSAGGNQPHANMQPYLVMNWVIAFQGVFPTRN